MIELGSSPHTVSRGLQAEMPDLIAALGRPDFPRRLFQAARKFTDCHSMTSFAFGADRAPRLLFAENVGEVPVSRQIADKYIADYWRFDPANRVAPEVTRGACCRAMLIGADEIVHASYRAYCYAAVKLVNRLTIMRRVGDNVIRLNVYRGRGNRAFDRGIDAIAEAGDVLVALIARHDAWAAKADGGEDFEYLDRLRDLCPSMPRRQLEVCALIVRGFFSQAIALKLGISLNTVLTFRRRAYARLRISSQNELTRLVLS